MTVIMKKNRPGGVGMESEEKSRPNESGVRLDTKQQAEIGNVLLSARSISRQLVGQAKQQAEEILQEARRQAEQIAAEAQTKAAAIVDEAEKQAAVIIQGAEGEAEAIICQAEEKTGPIMSRAEEKAAAIIQDAEEHAAVLLREAERNADAPAEPEKIRLPEEMQEYVVHCVGDCFAELRQQQLASIDLINKRWQGFLSNLMLEETPPASAEISRKDIETKVNVIAREMNDIIRE